MVGFPLYTTSKVSSMNESLNDGLRCMGGQEYLIKIKVFDPLGEQKLIEATDKLYESTNGLFWDFSKVCK